uniref:Cyclin-like domain-containing protein n=1 Tax=Panagrolaimus sp. JU765 TaxID=591449 RepID=A0AC34Q919_9BILA
MSSSKSEISSRLVNPKLNANSDWLFSTDELLDAPSLKDGMTLDEERELRTKGCEIILKVGCQLNLREDPTIASAWLIFHRFYMVKSFKNYPYTIAALGSLFVAGKTEETPKKCRDLIATAQSAEPTLFTASLHPKHVFNIERAIIETLGFSLHFTNPYKPLIEYARSFKVKIESMKHVVQFAWSLLNECSGTVLRLQYESEIIAIAILELSFKFYNTTSDKLYWDGKKTGVKWYEQYVEDLSQGIIDDIGHAALDAYEKNGKRQAEKEAKEKEKELKQPKFEPMEHS